MESFSKLTAIVLMQSGAQCAAALSTLLFLTACGGGGGGVGAPAASGSLDTSFGTNGIVTTPIGNGDDRVNAMAIQGDGKIVTAGYFSNGTNTDFALARYNANGGLDTGFGPSGTGVVTTPIGGAFDRANAIAIQGDGRIVAAGGFEVIGQTHIAVARYNADGNLDATFGTSGRGFSTTVIDNGSTANAVAIQSDGKIVVAGSVTVGSGLDVVLVRYNADGTRDNAFGTIGIATAGLIGIAAVKATAVAIQSDGKLVVAGTSRFLGAPTSTFVLLRFNTNGSPDNTFGAGGLAFPSIGTSDEALALAIQADGKIVVGGGSTVLGLSYYVVVRYDASGNPDRGFGTNGFSLTQVGASGSVRGIALQDDGKIVVTGDAYNGSNPDFGLVRYKANGGVDTSFGTNGIVMTPVRAAATNEATAVAIQSDGNIVAAGFAYAAGGGSSGDFAVARYHR